MKKTKRVAVPVVSVELEKVEEVTVPAKIMKADKGGSYQQTLQNLVAKLEAIPRFTQKNRMLITFPDIFDVVSPEGEEGMAVIKKFITDHVRPRFRLRKWTARFLVKAVHDFRERRSKAPKLVAGLNMVWIECLVENIVIGQWRVNPMADEPVFGTQAHKDLLRMVRILEGLPPEYTWVDFIRNFYRDFGAVLPKNPRDVLWPFLKQHVMRRFKMTKKKISSFWRQCVMGWPVFIDDRRNGDVSPFLNNYERIIKKYTLIPDPDYKPKHKQKQKPIVPRRRGDK